MSAINWGNVFRVHTERLAELARENQEQAALFGNVSSHEASLLGRVRELERENADLHDTLDVVIAADERAVERWRTAHPGNELVIPDRARLVGWLLEQLAARKEVQP